MRRTFREYYEKHDFVFEMARATFGIALVVFCDFKGWIIL